MNNFCCCTYKIYYALFSDNIVSLPETAYKTGYRTKDDKRRIREESKCKVNIARFDENKQGHKVLTYCHFSNVSDVGLYGKCKS